jgi:hypothetical protein
VGAATAEVRARVMALVTGSHGGANPGVRGVLTP